jgi:hypothetical protein
MGTSNRGRLGGRTGNPNSEMAFQPLQVIHAITDIVGLNGQPSRSHMHVIWYT